MWRMRKKNRISSRIRAPFDGIGKLDVTIENDGKPETIKVDDEWLKKERKRIEDAILIRSTISGG